MAFTVRNLSKEALTYHMKAVLLVPGSDTVDTKYGKRDVMLANDVLLREVDLGQVTVPASGNTKVEKMVTLTDAEKAQLSETFQNGTYVEGFIILTDAEERIPRSVSPSWPSSATGPPPPSLTPLSGQTNPPMVRTF